ncbi:MAG: serine hydrolase domain-containing protein, partial [Bacteroidota bacterium]
MKNQLQKKLSAFIVTAMMFSASANAQIVHTDVNPDVTKNTNAAYYKNSTPNHSIHGGNSSGARLFSGATRKTDYNNIKKGVSQDRVENISDNQGLKQSKTSLDKFILNSMANHHIPGLAASIIKDGKIVWTKGYGYANIEKNIPFTSNTANAELASISKTIAATALMKLYEQGAFQLDDPINNYLPFAVINPYFPNVPITFHMLLNHRSSINDYNLAYSPYLAPGTSGSLSDFLQSILVPGGAFYADSTSFYNYEPGSEFNYSNYGFALIGY